MNYTPKTEFTGVANFSHLSTGGYTGLESWEGF